MTISTPATPPTPAPVTPPPAPLALASSFADMYTKDAKGTVYFLSAQDQANAINRGLDLPHASLPKITAAEAMALTQPPPVPLKEQLTTYLKNKYGALIAAGADTALARPVLQIVLSGINAVPPTITTTAQIDSAGWPPALM